MDFLTITSRDRWFEKHPEKIAGKEYQTTSLFFPIMVKGTKEDVLRVTGISSIDQQQKIKIAKAVAILLKRKRNESLQRKIT